MKKNNDTNDGFEPILPTSNEEGTGQRTILPGT